MNSATNPGWQTSEFWTMLLANVVAAALAKGWITSGEASTLSSNLPIIGAILISMVSSVSYIFTRFFLKLRLGPVPALPTLPDAAVVPVVVGPASPSYGPPSTGMEPPAPTDVPTGVI